MEIIVVLPTAIDTVLLASENITQNLLKNQPSLLTGQSLYRRAYQIVNETDEMYITRVVGKK